MSRLSLVIIVLMVIATSTFLIFITDKTPYKYKPGIWPEADNAVSQAAHVYNLAKERNLDMSSGPCLSNSLISGWVLDIVHSPRSADDDLVDNQCGTILNGQAKHIIELDPEGNLVRVK